MGAAVGFALGHRSRAGLRIVSTLIFGPSSGPQFSLPLDEFSLETPLVLHAAAPAGAASRPRGMPESKGVNRSTNWWSPSPVMEDSCEVDIYHNRFFWPCVGVGRSCGLGLQALGGGECLFLDRWPPTDLKDPTFPPKGKNLHWVSLTSHLHNRASWGRPCHDP